MVKKGDLEIRNGNYKNKIWKGRILFKRTSWFQELNLLYDVLVWKVSEKSKFFEWFSEEEAAKVKSCSSFIISLSYQMDQSKLSHQMFFEQIRKYDYELVNMNNFYNQLKFHPDFTENSLSLYRFEGLCLSKKKDDKDVVINFPGFESKILN